ncbi:hypothetical protein Tco_1436581 [Tanacetum coccineum]
MPDIRSPGVDGPPVMPEDPYAYVVSAFQAPPSPDYVLGPEYPPSPGFVPKPVYPEFMPPEDEILLAEEQPPPIAISPTADSPSYVLESDPEENPEEDDDKDPEEDPADYPADGGDDDDDEDESSDDDEDEDASFVEETELFETDESAGTPPPPVYLVTARISIRDDPPTPFWSDTEIPSPPLPPVLSPLPVSSPSPASPIRPLGYRAAMIRLRAEAPSSSHSLPLPPPIILSHTRSEGTPSSGTPLLLPILLPTSSPPLLLLSIDRRADRPEVTLLPQTRLGIALGPRFEVGESSSAPTARPPRGIRADYGFVATMNREIMRDLERDVKFTNRVRQNTDDIYTRLDDEQSERQLMAGRLNMLYRDRRTHARTARLVEAKARMSREAWGRSMDASDLARAEVMSLRTQVVVQQAVITELQAADRRRQAAITEMLAAERMRQA